MFEKNGVRSLRLFRVMPWKREGKCQKSISDFVHLVHLIMDAARLPIAGSLPKASHGVTCCLIPFFLFPRVKSEAIVARREPKEEVEDVSSYLCTELVYDITKMPAGKGGCFTYLYCFMYMSPEMQIAVPLLVVRARVVNGLWLMSMKSLHTTFKPESGTEEQPTQYHCAAGSFCSQMLEHCPAQYHPDLELNSSVQWWFFQSVKTVRLFQKSLSPCWQ